MQLCEYGCGNSAAATLKNGKWCCEVSSNKCPAIRKKNSNGVLRHRKTNPHKPIGMKGKKGKNRFIKAKERGEIIQVSDITRQKISESGKGRTHSEETKKRLSDVAKSRHANGWNPVCGRAKKYKYVSKIAGEITVDGTWELIAAKYLDEIGVTWNRNTTKFDYIHLNGNPATYTPDFYVTDWNSYIEVKGYETELDRCKWKQFPHTLLVWKKDKINSIRTVG